MKSASNSPHSIYYNWKYQIFLACWAFFSTFSRFAMDLFSFAMDLFTLEIWEACTTIYTPFHMMNMWLNAWKSRAFRHLTNEFFVYFMRVIFPFEFDYCWLSSVGWLVHYVDDDVVIFEFRWAPWNWFLNSRKKNHPEHAYLIDLSLIHSLTATVTATPPSPNATQSALVHGFEKFTYIHSRYDDGQSMFYRFANDQPSIMIQLGACVGPANYNKMNNERGQADYEVR